MLGGRIDQLAVSLNARIDVLGAELRAEVHSTLRTNAYLTIGATAALVGLVGAITALG